MSKFAAKSFNWRLSRLARSSAVASRWAAPWSTTDDATYGTVWVPSAKEVGPDFQPYVTAGHWVYDNDWIWASVGPGPGMKSGAFR